MRLIHGTDAVGHDDGAELDFGLPRLCSCIRLWIAVHAVICGPCKKQVEAVVDDCALCIDEVVDCSPRGHFWTLINTGSSSR